jgi:hypothetical protein
MARPNINTVPPLIPGTAPASNISNLRALVDSDFKGATVSFNVAALTNTTGIVLLRSLTNSILAAVQLESVPLAVGAYNYDDRASTIVGKQVWYWLALESSAGYVTYVGDITVTVKQGSAPQAVNWIEASSNFSGDDSVQVNVVCEAVAGTDVSGGIAVFVAGYQGNPAQVLIYQDTNETLSFHLKITGENVLLYAATVNAAGELSALSGAVALLLNGAATKPCRLTGLSALEGNGFTQISFSAGPEPGIILYRLYRGPYGGTFAQAAIVATIVPTDEAQYSMQDKVVNGGSLTYQWYVTAVGPAGIDPQGESDPSDAIYPTVPWA